MGFVTPTDDTLIFGNPPDCTPTETLPGLFQIDPVLEVAQGLYAFPSGSARYDPGLIEFGACWDVAKLCNFCRPALLWDDSWTELADFLSDAQYRVELAPWFRVDIPESAEFGGVWVVDVTGFGPLPVARPVSELVGSGGAAGRHRDTSRTLTFKAYLTACSNAGLEYGLSWLDCQLRDTKDRDDSVLRFLSAHPQGSRAQPARLVRELHGVVYTKTVEVDGATSGNARQATAYSVNWQMVATNPYSYAPPVSFTIDWDQIIQSPPSGPLMMEPLMAPSLMAPLLDAPSDDPPVDPPPMPDSLPHTLGGLSGAAKPVELMPDSLPHTLGGMTGVPVDQDIDGTLTVTAEATGREKSPIGQNIAGGLSVFANRAGRADVSGQPVSYEFVSGTSAIRWVSGGDCEPDDTCETFPALSSQRCLPDEADIDVALPLTCGGELPVCSVNTAIFTLPYALRSQSLAGPGVPSTCALSAVSTKITNNATTALTAQVFWRRCAADVECEQDMWPVQITELPPETQLVLDGITARAHVVKNRRRWRPQGIVSTPSGSPWTPPLIDRQVCWQFVVVYASGADFDVQMSLYDREL